MKKVYKKFASFDFIRTFAIPLQTGIFGEMAEWSNAAVLKTVDLHGSGGSNPSLSAKHNEKSRQVYLDAIFFVVFSYAPPQAGRDVRPKGANPGERDVVVAQRKIGQQIMS